MNDHGSSSMPNDNPSARGAAAQRSSGFNDPGWSRRTPYDVDAESTTERDEPTVRSVRTPPRRPRPIGNRFDIDRIHYRQRRGPFGSLLIRLSGADQDILDMVPTEEKKYQLLGMLVLSTGVLAFAASAWGLQGTVDGWASIAIAALLGGAVLVVDRSLVSLPLNPVKLPAAVGQSLWDPIAGTDAMQDRYGEIVEQSRRRRGNLLSVLLRLIPRIMVAVALSFIIAEGVLLVKFKDDVDRRAQAILDETRATQRRSITTFFQTQIDAKNADIQRLSVGGHGDEIAAATKRLDEDLAKKQTMENDVNLLEQIWQAEKNGKVLTVTLSDGTKLTSSGQPKCKERCQSYKTLQAQTSTQIGTLNGVIANDQAVLAKFQAAAKQDAAKNAADIAKDYTDIESLRATMKQRLDQVDGDVAPSVLVQIQALEELAQDPTPAVREQSQVVLEGQSTAAAATATGVATESTNPANGTASGTASTNAAAVATVATKACSGSGVGKVFCDIRRWIVPPTPLGPQIAAWRYFFLLFDLMPILAKVILSMRKVRPYEEAEAGLSLLARVRMLNTVDHQLNAIGSEWEERAATRRRGRRAAIDGATSGAVTATAGPPAVPAPPPPAAMATPATPSIESPERALGAPAGDG